VAAAHRRVLIDWDWGAHGIWTILSAEELAAPAPGGLWLSHKTPASEDGRHPSSDRLSPGLLEARQDWNDRGARLFHYARPDEPGEQELVVFCSQAAELARGVDAARAWSRLRGPVRP